MPRGAGPWGSVTLTRSGGTRRVLRLEDLLLANLVVRRGLASPPEVQAALAALDRAPQRADLIAALAARGGPLGQPQVRSEAIAGVKRFVVGRAEQIMASRLRAANVLPPAALDELVARQRAEGFAWLLADRLTHEGRLDAGRRAALEQEVARDLAEYGASLVARHRATATSPRSAWTRRRRPRSPTARTTS